MVNERRIRWQCRRLLREFDMRPPLEVAELCRRVGAHRGLPIRLVEWPLAIPGATGLSFEAVLAGTRSDVIVYQKEASRWHQNHIILHELGHILADGGEDDGEDPSSEADFAQIALRIPFGDVRRRFRRTCYDCPNEREAELIATIIMEWAVALDAPPTVVGHAGTDSMRTSLSYRVGWL